MVKTQHAKYHAMSFGTIVSSRKTGANRRAFSRLFSGPVEVFGHIFRQEKQQDFVPVLRVVDGFARPARAPTKTVES